MKKSNAISIRVDKNFKKTIKGLSADLDETMVKLTRDLSEYKEEIKDLLKNKKL